MIDHAATKGIRTTMSVRISSQVKVWIADAIVHGGERQRAARKAEAIIGGLSIGRSLDEVGRSTSHGETRLRCTKYDLGNGFRLVILLRSSGIIVLHIDHHDGTDRWLNMQQGKVFHVEGIDEAIELPDLGVTQPDVPAAKGDTMARLIAPLPDSELDDLPLKPSDVRALTRLTPESSDEDLAKAVAELGEIKSEVLQVLQFLRNGDNFAACKTLHELHESLVTPTTNEPETPVDDSAPMARALTKKQRRAARRASRAEQAVKDENSFNKMDAQTLRNLRDRARIEAEAIQKEEEEQRRLADERAEDDMSFAELLERYEAGD